MTTRPVLVALEMDDGAIGAELQKRYGGDYDVVRTSTPDDAREQLARLRDGARRVALVLAAFRGDDPETFGVLDRAAALHPSAKRGFAIPWGDRGAADVIFRAAAIGRIDFYTIAPWRPPNEDLHQRIGEVLREWVAENTDPFEMVRVVAGRGSARAHEIRDLLTRNGIPHGSYDVHTPAGGAVLREVGAPADRLPVLVLFTGEVSIDPTNAELARALGVRTQPREGSYDVVVVGGGPSGLAASVYASSEGLRTTLLEREAIGGQAGTTSLIRNYLGFPRGVSGRELAQRSYEQAWLFGTEFVYANEVTGLRAEADHRIVTLADGTEVRTRAVVLATGVTYRRLGIGNLERFVGAGVYYGAAVTEADAVRDRPAVVVGGGNSAGQAAVHLADVATHVTLLVRGPSLAESMSDYLIRQLDRAPNVDVRFGVELVDGVGDVALERVIVRDRATGATQELHTAAVFVLIGAEPRTGWLPDEVARDPWGFVLTGDDVAGQVAGPTGDRAPMPLETSMPGVFAVGDVRHRSVKRVASAVGEGSISIRLVHEYLDLLGTMAPEGPSVRVDPPPRSDAGGGEPH